MSEPPAAKPKPICTALPTSITFWLLFTAPGRLMRFALPYSAHEAAQRLRAEGALVKQTGARIGYTVMLRLPESRTERRFNGWLEPDGTGATRSWLTGRPHADPPGAHPPGDQRGITAAGVLFP